MKKIFTCLLCLIFTGCATPSVEKTICPLTEEKICELKNNTLKVPKNLVAAWLELSTQGYPQGSSSPCKIRGTLIVRRADKSYKFNHDEHIIFILDKKPYKIHPTSVTNVPFSSVNRTTSSVPYGKRSIYIPIANIDHYTDTNYKLVLDRDFLNLLCSCKEVMITLGHDQQEGDCSEGSLSFEEKNFKAIKDFYDNCISASNLCKD